MRPLQLRSLTAEECVLLDAKIREKTLPARLQDRYRIILEASRGHVAGGIAERVGCSLNTVWRWVRRLLRRDGISFQRTKTWKESPDPDFEVKKPPPRPLHGAS